MECSDVCSIVNIGLSRAKDRLPWKPRWQLARLAFRGSYTSNLQRYYGKVRIYLCYSAYKNVRKTQNHFNNSSIKQKFDSFKFIQYLGYYDFSNA